MPDLPVLAETVLVSRESLACRLLDSSMSDEDKDFLRNSIVRKGSRGIYFRASERLNVLMRERGAK